MGEASFVAGDWGTTRLRAFLCDPQGAVLEQANGPGARESAGHFANALDSVLAHWRRSHGELPVVLCGMVGSSFGWVQAPYMACPARPEQIAAACVALRGGSVHIVPGLSCRNRLGAPDVLRGEETQILGALLLDPALGRGTHLLCLPGTHTKWVVLDDGSVREFQTTVTGELFDLVCEHSVLVRDAQSPRADDQTAFGRGLEEFHRFPHVSPLHRIFECRSRRLNGELAPEAAASYLSGLLVAGDVSSAVDLFAPARSQPVRLIGAPELTRLYALALAAQGRETATLDGAATSTAGLTCIHRLLSSREVVREH
jgi:2-dehydro-3-deoxygalactonokinase